MLIERNATHDDLSTLVYLAKQAQKEVPYKMLQTNWLKVAYHFDVCLRQFAVVFEEEGEVIGCFLGQQLEPWYSTETVAYLAFSYVLPEFRNTGAGLRGFRTFKRWAKAIGRPMYLAHESAEASERMDKIYERLGLTKVGSQFLEV